MKISHCDRITFYIHINNFTYWQLDANPWNAVFFFGNATGQHLNKALTDSKQIGLPLLYKPGSQGLNSKRLLALGSQIGNPKTEYSTHILTLKHLLSQEKRSLLNCLRVPSRSLVLLYKVPCLRTFTLIFILFYLF